MHQDFQKRFRKRIEVETGAVGVYLAHQHKVDEARFTVESNRSGYIDDLPERFETSNRAPVSTPALQRLSGRDSGANTEKLAAGEYGRRSHTVGCLLRLARWTRPDISFAVWELSAPASPPGGTHMAAVKRQSRCRQGSRGLGPKRSTPGNRGPRDRPGLRWGFVGSDRAGCSGGGLSSKCRLLVTRRCWTEPPLRARPGVSWH